MAYIERKIGNYIHYSHLDYLKYGLGTKDNPDPEGGSTLALALQRQRILAEIKRTVRPQVRAQQKEIENQLNFFRLNNQSDLSNFKTWTPEIINRIEKKIHEVVMQRIQQTYDTEELKAYANAGEALSQGYKLKKEVVDNKKGEFRKELSTNGKNVADSIRDRLKIIGETLKAGSAQQLNKIDDIKKLYKQLETEWNAIDTKGSYYVYFDKKSNFISRLNQLWGEFLGSTESYVSGEIGEQYAAISQLVFQNVKDKTVQEVEAYLDQLITATNQDLNILGKDTGAVAYSKKNFAVTGRANISKDKHFSELDTFTDFSGGKFRLHATQNKVDLIVTLDELKIPASIKNYNLESKFGVHLHSGKSILSLTQEYTEFMNHYLNITTVSGGKTKEYGIEEGNDLLRGWIGEANEVLKLTMGFKALAGGIYKQTGAIFGPNQMAEIFIVNGNDGLYKVYFIDDIMFDLSNNLSLLQIKDFSSTKIWHNLWISGDPSLTSGYRRIANLLQQLHKFNLDISINKSYFLTKK